MTIEELKSLMRRTQRCLTPLCLDILNTNPDNYDYAPGIVRRQ